MADTGKHMSRSKSKNGVKLKYTTIVSTVEGTENKTENDLSLQEAFKRYRKAKQWNTDLDGWRDFQDFLEDFNFNWIKRDKSHFKEELRSTKDIHDTGTRRIVIIKGLSKKELKKAKLLRKRNELRKADPAKMAALRKKFIAQAKKYFGYPYARKYWPPDSPEYKSKLFLDCCGLVRQVMRDLTYDFGFVIGPWNQAYMFDTLPKTVAREEDMQPGDLVFVSATYVNPKSKKQRHNMTHVEIWLGDGPKTIGARWNNGKVQVWDHYKFKAKSYYNETYHFKSLDTWLKGICESFCSEHRWKRRKYVPSKKSIFHVESDQSLTDDQDERAGDDGNEEDDNPEGKDLIKAEIADDIKDESRDNKDIDKNEKYGDEEETDDEMCNASPDEDDDEIDFDEETERLDGDKGGTDMDEENKGQGKNIRIEDLCISEQFSVDLNNRGLYLQDIVEKSEQGHNDDKDMTDGMNTFNTNGNSKNDREISIGGSLPIGDQDETTDVQSEKKLTDKLADTSITDELQNLSDAIESALTNQKTDDISTKTELANKNADNISDNTENANQNALPKKDGSSAEKQMKVSGVPSACSLHDDSAESLIGAESIASDISLASSQNSDKGAN